MLRVTPGNLYEEIESAERYRDSHLEHYNDVIKDYVGPMFGGVSIDDFSPENHVYEYLSLTVPRLIHDNPRVRVTTRRPVSQGNEAAAIEHGLNRWTNDTNVKDVLQRVAFDTLLAYGVLMTAQAPMPGYDPRSNFGKYWPNCYRISPKRFVIDPLALSFNEARFMGHMWVRDREDLLEEAKTDPTWNAESIEMLTNEGSIDHMTNEESRQRDTPERNEVTVFDIWVPEIQLKESPGPEYGFHGTIYTVAVGTSYGERDPDKADFIRDPRPYYGPPSGPYTMFGAYYVPDGPYPLSPIMATTGQVNELNDHVRSASASAARYKRLVLVDAKNKKLVQDVKSQPHDFVVPVEGIDKDAVVQLELGGITNQQVSYIQMARERLDRNSGIHDAMRGNVTGNATATEVSIAEGSSTIRLAYLKNQFEEAVRQVLKSVGWYLHNDDRVSFPLGADAAAALGVAEPWFVGGSSPDSPYSDLELEIESYSMERTTESLQQRRAMEAFQIIANVASAMPQMPYVNWNSLLDKMGDALNMPDLSGLVDTEMLMAMMQQQQQQEQQQMEMEQINAAAGSGGMANA
tara:strand:+ start:7023 stop:8747 length:1725 start_codon:yes stop_codon:yes gene_type:complete